MLRGTYAGLASPAVLEYLTSLGITAVELLPVHHHVDEHALVQRGLTNYWGYNTIGFFAPDARYARTSSQGQHVHEFKGMVKVLHQAGIEVILDVVYNHAAEGNHLGPALCLRGIDNAAYYRLTPDAPRYYMDYTGCGNTLNMHQPRAIQLLMDSLRYWILEMHVDGFRFDLASALARELHDVDRLSTFFDVIHQDPVISQVKLIAEPWDLGEGGYQVGNFPVGWAEWNGRYRDAIRRYWRGDPGQVADLARQLLAFTQRLLRLRHAHPEFRRRKFFQGRPLCAADMKDLLWLRPDGGEMSPEEWQQSTLQAFGFRLCGQAMDEVDAHGEAITDDTLLILLNAQAEPVAFVLPEAHPGTCWEGVVDTTGGGDAPAATARLAVGTSVNLGGRSLQLLRACG